MSSSEPNKKGGRKKRKPPNISNVPENIDNQTPKKKKRNPSAEGIAKSKQLMEKFKKRNPRTRASTSRCNKEPRLCGNGKPMPSLADLEKMYDDDTDDEQPTTTNTANPAPVRCVTPVPDRRAIPDDKLMSPTTLKQIASSLLDRIEKLPTTALENDQDGPPPPIIPQKKRKKSDTPYIVGCKDRPQVPWQPKTSFCKGDVDYGVDKNCDLNEDDSPTKRRKRSTKVNLSKSIFNAKSDEIASRLKESDTLDPPGSPDSNKTVEYDINSTSPSQLQRSFSPLPSTSKDQDTILKNEQLFNESLCIDNDNSRNDIQLIEETIDVITIDDTIPDNSVDVVDTKFSYMDDDCCVIVELDDVKKTDTHRPLKIEPPKDDFYGSVDLNMDNDIIDIVDIDDVIEENRAIIKKICKTQTNLDTVTLVEPNISYTTKKKVQNTQQNNSNTNNSQNIPDVLEVNSDNAAGGNVVTQNSASGVTSSCVNNNTNHYLPEINSDIVDVESYNAVADYEDIHNSPEPTRTSSIADVVSGFFNNPINMDVVAQIAAKLRAFPQFSKRRRNQGLFNMNTQNADNITSRGHNTHTLSSTTSHLSNFVVTNITYVPSNNNAHSNKSPISNVEVNTVSSAPVNIASPAPVKNTRTKDSHQLETQRQNTGLRGLGDCPICLDNLSNKAVASTLCGHIFCMNCIKAAIKANGKKCPTCRKPLKGVGYHQLFL